MSFTNLEDPSLAKVRAAERAKLAAFRASGKLSSSSYYMSRANDRGGVFFEFAAADRARLAEAVKDIYDICVWLEPYRELEAQARGEYGGGWYSAKVVRWEGLPDHPECQVKDPDPSAAPAPVPPAEPPPAASSGSPAPAPRPAADKPRPDKLSELLPRSATLTEEERTALVAALGFPASELSSGVEGQPVAVDEFKVAWADVDDHPGDEAVVSFDAPMMMSEGGTPRFFAVVRVEGGKATVLWRQREQAGMINGGGLAGGLASRSAILAAVDGSQPGKKHLLLTTVSVDVAPGPGAGVSQSWSLASFRGEGRLVHLEGSDQKSPASDKFDQERDPAYWKLAREGAKLVRRDPTGRTVETWTWDDAAKRWQGTGPHGKWWEKKSAKKRR